MNNLQNDINLFYEAVASIMEKILGYYRHHDSQKVYERIIKPAKKLSQKCSYKSTSDTSNLCSLAYWLYIYGNKEMALEICELCHTVTFDFEYREIGMQNIYGLEIRIARELLNENRKNQFVPTDYFFSKRLKKHIRFPQILREDEIASLSDRALDLIMFYSICDMIGNGEIGLYTELNEHWDTIEQTIKKYIKYLQAF